MLYGHREQYEFVPANKVIAIDTTAAGDTFIGYFIASYLQQGLTIKESLQRACKAAAVCVTRRGGVYSENIEIFNQGLEISE